MTTEQRTKRIEKCREAIAKNWQNRDSDWTGRRYTNPHRMVIRSSVRLIRVLTF